MKVQHWMKTVSFVAIMGLILGLAACMTMPGYNQERLVREKIVLTAHDTLGIPYHYSGDSPHTGFDCSGLARYSYQASGIDIPRTTKDQYRFRHRVSKRNLEPGDLVFFKHWFRVTHVGIYIGNNKFIHAPKQGQSVKVSSLSEKHWRKRYAGGGNYLTGEKLARLDN